RTLEIHPRADRSRSAFRCRCRSEREAESRSLECGAGKFIAEGSRGEVRHSAGYRRGSAEPAGASYDVRGPATRRAFPLGLPAAPRCIGAVYAKSYVSYRSRPSKPLSEGAGYRKQEALIDVRSPSLRRGRLP